jgi:Tol biopolymer transport system component
MNYYQPGKQFDTITTRGNDGPLFSPDGKWIALVPRWHLHVMPVDNTGKPAGRRSRSTTTRPDSISWSGDSNWILYENNGKLQEGEPRRNPESQGAARLDVPYRRRARAARSSTPAGSGTARHPTSRETSTS